MMPQNIHVFTSAALNYLPKVRILFHSLRRHHPEWKLHLLLVDELPADLDLSQEPLDAVTPISELGIEEWRGWSFCHTITELATAAKPFMLRRLLDNSGEGGKVLYLDPDTVVFSRLDDITEALDEASILLTPHQTRPETTLAAVIDNEICSLKHGIYNLGFIAVANTPTGRDFAKWWSDRTYFFCRDDIPNGLFTDQRWIDLVPALFTNVAIMRSGRHNLATWNITTRTLTTTPDHTFEVDGEPLGFYHFTGFDSGAHRVMALKNGGDNAAMAELIQWYSDKIKPLATDPLTHRRWSYMAFSDGTAISRDQRLIYRLRRDLQRRFPDPFLAGEYDQWWASTARKEYPDLFVPQRQEAARRQLTASLTPGFFGAAETDQTPLSLPSLLQQAIRDPRSGLALGRKGWEVLRNEGIGGVKRRLG